MPVAPSPAEIFRRAAEEGERRLGQSLLELVATGFIAGFTVVFGVAALGVVHALTGPVLGEAAAVAGALAFAPGLVFLVVGRAELFSEDFFDPAATVAERREDGMAYRVLRLWSVTLALNLVGGALLALVVAVPGVLPEGAAGALGHLAEDLAGRGAAAAFASAVVGGALVALLSFLLQAAGSVGGQIAMAFLVGFVLALGPFDHVVVTALHVFFGVLFGADVGWGDVGAAIGTATAGNVVGGLGLVTLSHVAQAKGAE